MMRVIGIALVVALLQVTARCAWELELNHPESGMYQRGEEAAVVLRWSGAQPPAPVPQLQLFDYLDHQAGELPAPTGTGNEWRVVVPTDRMGYFEVRCAGDSQSLIPAVGSRPAGRLTLAVVDKINPNPSDDFKYRFLSIQGTTIMRQRDGQPYGWDMYPYLGIQAIGINYGWAQMEPGSAADFDKVVAVDHSPQWVRETKMFPYFHLSTYPRWAIDVDRLPAQEKAAASTTRLPPRDFAQYEAYLQKAVPYLARQYNFLPYRTYEILWEPVSPWGWYGSDEEIGKVFATAHRVIHQHDPNGIVAGPTLSTLSDLTLFERLLKAGLGQYLDVVAFHPYKGYPPEKNAIPESLDAIRRMTKRYVGRELPFIGTEFGFPQSSCGSALNQAYGITSSILIFKGEGALMHTIFYLGDFAGEPGYGFMYNLVPGLPFGPGRVSPKPSVPMIRAAVDQVGRAQPIGRLDYLGADIWGYVYRDGGTLLAALWDASDKDRQIQFETGVPTVQVVDAFGNARPMQTADGRLNLKLTRAPVYIRGISPELYSAGAIRPLLDAQEVWTVYRGQTYAQVVQLTRTLSDSSAILSFDTDRDVCPDQVRQSLKLHAGQKATVHLAVSPTAPLGATVGYYRLRGDKGTLYRGVQRINVSPELELGPLHSACTQGRWTVRQSVRNVSPALWQGEYHVSLGGQALTSSSLSLTPGQQQDLVIPVEQLPDPTRPALATIEFQEHSGSSLKQQQQLTFYSVQRITTSLKAPADWDQLRQQNLVASEATIWKQHPATTYRGPGDLSAKVAYAYDDANLYAQFVVTDDVNRCTAPAQTTWTQDSLQLAFDVNPDRESNTNVLADQAQRGDCEFTCAFTTRGPEIYLHRAPGGSRVEVNQVLKYPGFVLDGGRQGATTVYRVTVPWAFLDPRGVRAQRLGIAAAINDSDAQTPFGDRKALLLFGGIVQSKDRSQFGQAVLEP